MENIFIGKSEGWIEQCQAASTARDKFLWTEAEFNFVLDARAAGVENAKLMELLGRSKSAIMGVKQRKPLMNKYYNALIELMQNKAASSEPPYASTISGALTYSLPYGIIVTKPAVVICLAVHEEILEITSPHSIQESKRSMDSVSYALTDLASKYHTEWRDKKPGLRIIPSYRTFEEHQKILEAVYLHQMSLAELSLIIAMNATELLFDDVYLQTIAKKTVWSEAAKDKPANHHKEWRNDLIDAVVVGMQAGRSIQKQMERFKRTYESIRTVRKTYGYEASRHNLNWSPEESQRLLGEIETHKSMGGIAWCIIGKEHGRFIRSVKKQHYKLLKLEGTRPEVPKATELPPIPREPAIMFDGVETQSEGAMIAGKFGKIGEMMREMSRRFPGKDGDLLTLDETLVGAPSERVEPDLVESSSFMKLHEEYVALRDKYEALMFRLHTQCAARYADDRPECGKCLNRIILTTL